MYITAKVQQELPPKSLFKRQNHHPSGQDCIKVGDTVMIVTTHTGFNDILDILDEER